MSFLKQQIQPAAKAQLVPMSLKDLDADRELSEHYARAMLLYEESTEDETVSVTQKVQSLNAITSLIQAITKTKVELHTAERIKLLEGVLIQTLKEFPEMHEKFMGLYEERLKDLDD